MDIGHVKHIHYAAIGKMLSDHASIEYIFSQCARFYLKGSFKAGEEIYRAPNNTGDRVRVLKAIMRQSKLKLEPVRQENLLTAIQIFEILSKARDSVTHGKMGEVIGSKKCDIFTLTTKGPFSEQSKIDLDMINQLQKNFELLRILLNGFIISDHYSWPDGLDIEINAFKKRLNKDAGNLFIFEPIELSYQKNPNRNRAKSVI